MAVLLPPLEKLNICQYIKADPVHASTFTHLLIYLLTPWSRVVHEKQTGSQLDKKFPAFCGTRRFITAFTRAHYLFLP